jgi:hypothetical protein
MRQRPETIEHPFGTIEARMGATHFLTRGCTHRRRDVIARGSNGLSAQSFLRVLYPTFAPSAGAARPL